MVTAVLVRFLWLSMNMIFGFLSSQVVPAPSAFGPFNGYPTVIHQTMTHTHTGEEDATEILYLDIYKSLQDKGQGHKCSLLTHVWTHLHSQPLTPFSHRPK